MAQMYGQYPYGTAQITTPILNQPPITQQQTQASINQGHANAAQAGTPKFLMKQFGGGGFRSGPGAMSAAMPQMTAAQLAMGLVGPNQQLQDDALRAQHGLNVEQSQFGDVMGQLGNVTGLQNRGGNMIQQLLMQLLGG